MKFNPQIFLMLLTLASCGGGGSSGSDGGQPAPAAGNQPPQIQGQPGIAQEGQAFSFSPTVIDPDGDAVTVRAEGLPGWLNFDESTHVLSGVPTASDVGRGELITLTANDGRAIATLEFVIDVAFEPLEQALRTGDARYVDRPQRFIDSMQAASNDAVSQGAILRQQLFNLDIHGQARSDGSSLTDVSWNPTHDAGLLTATFGENTTLLFSNSVTHSDYTVQSQGLAVAGEQAGKNRNAAFVALASNPMRNVYRDSAAVNSQMQQWLRNSMDWLRGGDTRATFNVVIAQMSQSYYFPDRVATRQWLDDNYPEQVAYNEPQSCDGSALAGCLAAQPDLLIVSQVSAEGTAGDDARRAIEQWLAEGKPLLYMHHDGDLKPLGEAIFEQLGVTYAGDNYWRRLSVEGYDVRGQLDRVPVEVEAINGLIARFESGDFSVDLGLCADKNCPAESGYAQEFGEAAEYAQQFFRQLDSQSQPLFDRGGMRYYKSLLLLADSYRQTVRFPMDKLTTPAPVFLQAYFADHVQYQRRDINPVPADMGNFSRSDFSHIRPVSRRVKLTSRRHFRAAGVYALPGRTVTVRRIDSAAVATTIFVNTLRSGATHPFNENAYSRPKFLRGQALALAPGQTLRFTSAYGGPIQIGFDRNDEQVEFEFSEVGEHPYWAGEGDNADFAAAMARGDYDWAELSTPGFEVHSKLEKMRSSIAEWRSAAELAQATERYMYNFAHVLAGFQGEGIDRVSEIHQFAEQRGWQLDTIDVVKHMNADQATCGYGCSGNPYDAYWSFNPIGHGDLHELGHGLERGRFRFAGWDGHASTNPYSYYAKSQYFLDTGEDPGCQALPFDSLKQALLESRASADPFADMQRRQLNGWSEGVAITIQMMMSAQAEGVLSDGWHLLARLHIMDRIFNRADNSDESWLAEREALGFSSYSRAEARALSNNDWLAIALSQSTSRDMREYLAMWGLAISDKAAAQVASFAYPSMPLRFFDSGARDYCNNFQPASMAMD
ncbi:ImpA family metalloprotease [Spongiibacter marinus]|uniref:ImpA family metalloprotease n=1 Tax=Spongiibacter marinus TaxID=354246 RepID=UPI003C6397DA